MVVDLFGITLKYPSSTTNPQYYRFPAHSSHTGNNEMDNKIVWREPGTLISNVSGQSGNLTVNWWEYEPEEGTNVRAFILPSYLTSEDNSSKVDYDLDCILDQSQTNQRGYVNRPQEWKNVEITSHFFVRSVADPNGALYIQTRQGSTKGESGSNCCQFHEYGVELYWSTSSDFKGKFRFVKGQSSMAGSKIGAGGQIGGLFSQSVIPSFYQTWFAVKFVVFNVPNQPNRVRLELWLSPATFGNPSHATSNQWTRVAMVEDFQGFGWGKGGLECRAPSDDFPITWAAPFCVFGYVGGRVIQFNYTSFREIDPSGTFGEDPIPPEEPPTFPSPTVSDPDPIPPTTPDPQPPDATPPALPTSLSRRLTLRREVVNSVTCSCDGIQPGPPPDDGGGDGGTDPPGGGGNPPGGGGGGTGTFTQIYNVPVNTAVFGRLGAASGNTGYYLRFGQACTRTSSIWLGKTVNRVELTIAKQGNPTGNITCVVRRGTNDSVAATLTPTVTATSVTTAGTVLIFENLTNTYQMALNDKVLFEFAGGNTNDFIKIFMVEEGSQSGTKIMFQNNSQEAGVYGDLPNMDLCARIFTLTP